PPWKKSNVLTFGTAHSPSALGAQKGVYDATNELLRRYSEMLKATTVKNAKETQTGIVDNETIKKANQDIVSTIDQVLQIQREGREKRKVVEQELLQTENELKTHILKSATEENNLLT